MLTFTQKLGRVCFALAFSSLLLGCAASPSRAEVTTYPAPQGVAASDLYSVKADGKEVFVYKFPGAVDKTPIHVAYFDMSAPAKIEVTLKTGDIKTIIVRPQRYGFQPTPQGASASWTQNTPCNLSVEINDLQKTSLFLFSNPPETGAPKPDDPGVRYFGPGLHDMSGQIININDKRSIYLAGGAVVMGLSINGKQGDGGKVYGRGILTGNVQTKKATGFWMGGRNRAIEDVIMVRPLPGWHNVFNNVRGLRVKNYRVLGAQGNDDGFDFVGGQDITLDGVFIMAKDDNLAFKNYEIDRSKKPLREKYSDGPGISNVQILNSTFFNREWGNNLEIGHEFVGGEVKNILFKNLDIIHGWGRSKTPLYGAFSIHLAGDTKISDIRYEDIRVEELDEDQALVYLSIARDTYSFGRGRGSISDISFKNISYTGAKPTSLFLHGGGENALIQNVTFDNLRVGGKAITGPNDMTVRVSQYVKNLRFSPDGLSFSTPDGFKVATSFGGRQSSLMIDGNPDTRWTLGDDFDPETGQRTKARQIGGHWVMLDLGSGPIYKNQPVTFDSLKIDSGWATMASDYVLQVSDDGEKWSEPLPFEKSNLLDDEKRIEGNILKFAPQTKRFLRLTAKGKDASGVQERNNPWQIVELEVFNGAQKVDLSFPLQKTSD